MANDKFIWLRRCLLLLPALLLAGCSSQGGNFWLFNTQGPSAGASLHYMILDVLLMLIVIGPTTALVIWAMWRYRRNRNASYAPHWAHSNLIEVVVWSIPVIIVGVLSYFSYVGTRAVNPYNPTIVTRSVQARASKDGPLKVDVITTDWQWLFVYPQLHVAVTNRLVVPTNREIQFRLTSTSVTNDFYIPQLVGQIYVMPGMRTKQSMLVQSPGKYHGFSAEFSGPGFSWMNYSVDAVAEAQFSSWAKRVRAVGRSLSYPAFKRFARPTVNTGGKSEYFNRVQPGLFREIVKNVRNGKLAYKTPMLLTEDMHSKLFRTHTN